MADAEEMLRDPAFQRLLERRSRLRWGFSGLLIGTYLAWGILGVYFDEAYAAPFFGNTLPTGLALGFMIIGLSMILSAIYVRLVNRIEAEAARDRENSQ
jgi:uncharacterized membrane protein (DUF485 family)